MEKIAEEEQRAAHGGTTMQGQMPHDESLRLLL
jgi:hypothetical protein